VWVVLFEVGSENVEKNPTPWGFSRKTPVLSALKGSLLGVFLAQKVDI